MTCNYLLASTTSTRPGSLTSSTTYSFPQHNNIPNCTATELSSAQLHTRRQRVPESGGVGGGADWEVKSESRRPEDPCVDGPGPWTGTGTNQQTSSRLITLAHAGASHRTRRRQEGRARNVHKWKPAAITSSITVAFPPLSPPTTTPSSFLRLGLCSCGKPTHQSRSSFIGARGEVRMVLQHPTASPLPHGRHDAIISCETSASLVAVSSNCAQHVHHGCNQRLRAHPIHHSFLSLQISTEQTCVRCNRLATCMPPLPHSEIPATWFAIFLDSFSPQGSKTHSSFGQFPHHPLTQLYPRSPIRNLQHSKWHY